MKKSYVIFNAFLLISQCIISSENEQESALAKSSPQEQSALDEVIEAKSDSPHVVFDQNWMPYFLNFTPKTPPLTGLYSDFSNQNMLEKLQNAEDCINSKKNPGENSRRLKSNQDSSDESNSQNKSDEKSETDEEDASIKKQISMISMIGIPAVAIPTASTVALLVKNQHDQKKDIASILNAGGEIATGSWVPDAVKTGLGVGCGLVVVVGVVFGGIALKNKFLELHRKYQSGQRASTLENRQIKEQVSLMKTAFSEQNQVLRAVVSQQKIFQDAVIADIKSLTGSNDEIINYIRGKGGLIPELHKFQKAYEGIQTKILAVNARLDALEITKSSEGGAQAAPPKQDSKPKLPKK